MDGGRASRFALLPDPPAWADIRAIQRLHVAHGGVRLTRHCTTT